MGKIYFYKNKFNSNYFFYDDFLYKERFNFKKDSKFETEIQSLKLSEKYQNILNKKIYTKLNTYNKVNYSSRFWQILLNRWTKFYVDKIIYQYFYLSWLIKKKKIIHFYLKFKNKKIPNSLWEFYQILTDESTDNYLTYRILQCLKKNYPNIKIYHIKKKNYFKFSNSSFKFKNFFYKVFNSITFFFLKKNNPIIISSYIPFKDEQKLKNKTGQNFFWKTFFDDKNNELLNLLKKKRPKKRIKFFKTNNKLNLKNIMLDLIDEYLPSCYLENFNITKDFTTSNMIVKKPKYIFTSNEFLFNEFFKFYTVECLKNKDTKYYVGQHGSKYGCIKEQHNTIEEVTSDKFFTWGWKYNLKHKPLGVLNTLGKKKFSLPQKIDKIYIVNQNLPDAVTVFNTNYEFKNKTKNILLFLKNLKKKNYSKIIFRLHHSDHKNFKFYKNKISKISKKITIDIGYNKLLENVSANSLVIFTYYSSGFLEFLSLNKICYLFFNINKKAYLDSFYKNFIKLKKKVIFDDPVYFANFINKMCDEKIMKNTIYNDNNLKKFKKLYANYIQSINLVKKILL